MDRVVACGQTDIHAYREVGGVWTDRRSCVGSIPTKSILKALSFAEWFKVTYVSPLPQALGEGVIALHQRQACVVTWTLNGVPL